MAGYTAVQIVQIVAAAVAVGTSVYTYLSMEDPESVGSKVQKRGTRAPRKVPYGKSIIDSVNVYNNVTNYDSDWMLNIFSLGVGEIHKIHQVYVDDKELLRYENTVNPSDTPAFWFSRDQNHFVDAYDTQNIKMQFRYGKETEQSLNLAQNYSDSEWTTNHRGDRVPQVAIVLNRSTDSDTPIFSSRYTLTALVSGLSVHDPRYHTAGQKSFDHSGFVGSFPDPDNFECGRNPALCLLDFLTDGYYGMGIPYEYMDEQSFIDTANWCDANNLKIDGAVDTGESFSSCLQEILSSFFGALTITNGLVKCLYEDVVALPYPTTFDESNIIQISDIVGSNNDSYYNIVETEYKNHDMNEKGDVFQLPSDIYEIPAGETKSRIDKDGFVKTQKIEMPMTIDNYNGSGVTGAVKLFTNRAYIKTLYQRGVTIKIDLSQYNIGVFDVIQISNDALGWDNELFRVININSSVDNDDFNIGELLCKEYNDAMYDGTDDGVHGRTRTRQNKQLKQVTDLTFDLDNFINSGYGTLIWTNLNTTSNVEYRVEYKLSSSTEWDYLATVTGPIAKTPHLKLDNYDFRVQVKKFGWFSSVYTELLSQSVISTVELPTPTNVNIVSNGMDFNIFWDDMSDVEILNPSELINPDSGGTTDKVKDYFKYYKVDVYHSAVLVDTYYSTTPEYIYTFDQNKDNGLSRHVTVEVKIIALDGTESMAETDSTSNTQIGSPTGVNIFSKIGTINVYWSSRAEPDFSGTEIHMSTSAGFTPSGATLIGTTQQASTFATAFPDDQANRYISIGHYDVFDKDSMVYSTPTLVVYVPAFDDSELVQDLADLSNDLNNLGNDLTTLDGQVDNLGNDLTTLDGQLDNLDDQLNNPTTGLQKQLNDLNTELDNLDGDLTTLDGQLDNLDDQLNNPTTGLQKQLNDLNTELDNTFPITETQIADDSISTPKLKANSIVASKIAAGTITTNEIAAGTITANNIAINTITANEIAVGTITALEIGVNTITANNIAADTITANEIAVGTITALEIGVNTITANEIVADVVFGNDATFSGSLSAATGTFSGSLSAATGTFSGYINSHSTNNVPIQGVLESSSTLSTQAAYFVNFSEVLGGQGIFAGSSASDGKAVVAVAAGSSNDENYGVHSTAMGYDFYAAGNGVNYAPFTGSHDGLVLSTHSEIEVGDIVCDIRVLNIKNISNAICEMEVSETSNDKSARGVLVKRGELDINNMPAGLGVESIWLSLNYDRISFNALGEGAINVCGENGDIQIGDLITTSSMHGKGMKQLDQDNLKPYTVAQSRQNVTFSSPTEVKQIACIYKCG